MDATIIMLLVAINAGTNIFSAAYGIEILIYGKLAYWENKRNVTEGIWRNSQRVNGLPTIRSRRINGGFNTKSKYLHFLIAISIVLIVYKLDY